MNLKHAQYMLTILQEGSITAAARKLYVSQPSLSQMVKLVENTLGAPIFNRNTDPITLTFAGQKYIDAARQVLTINENLRREIDEINHEDHGVLRLGIPVQRAMQVLPYVMPRFLEKYPCVDIQIVEQGSATTETLVLEGEVDIGCLTTYPHHEELEYILIETEDVVLLTGKGSEIAKRIPDGTPIDITEAKNEKFITIQEGHSVRRTQDLLFIRKDIHPKVLLETMSIEVAKRTAVACNAVMICPRNYIEMTPELLPHSVMYPLLDIESRRSFYICHRKDRYLTKYMRDFIAMLTEKEHPFTKG